MKGEYKWCKIEDRALLCAGNCCDCPSDDDEAEESPLAQQERKHG